jgi:transcriptional regulator with XRE-family HTH domain
MKPLNVFIREIREDRDLTQAQVAKALGIAQQYYSKYETGDYELPIRHLIGLAKLYNLNTDYILGLTQYQYPIDKLKEPFSNEIAISKLVSETIALNSDGRKALIEYLEFLNKKQKSN